MSVFNRNFYSSIQQYNVLEERAFNEGTRVFNNVIPVNTSSIDTRQIDVFRQGVEITQNKHTLGAFKITAGTPGHIIKPVSFGINELDIISTGSFVEIDNFNPVNYIYLQEPGTDFKRVITFPIITADSNQAENFMLNGIIEPLSIRSVISFFSIEFPFESHAFRGEMMAGNTEQFEFSSDRILTVDYTPKKLVPLKTVASASVTASWEPRAFVNNEIYLDAFEIIKSGSGTPRQSLGYLDDNKNYIDSFVDNGGESGYLKSLGITAETHGQDMVNVFLIMTGSTDNYVPPGKKSATTGFVYDNIGYAGIDSIAFGGMTY